MPPADAGDAAGRRFVERPEAHGARDWRGALAQFVAETDRVADLLGSLMPEVRALDSGEVLTALHAAVSDRRHPVAVPETPMYLDGLLADTPLTGGLAPRLGEHHLRTLTVLGFPNVSRPAHFDALNGAAFPYRWVTRFIPLDRADAIRTLTRIRRQWFNKRKSLSALLREVMYNQASALTDSDADNKVADADCALQALGGDYVGFGYLTTTLTVWDTSAARADDKVRALERTVHGLGFTAKREAVNAVEAWLSSLPGQVYANVRQPLVHTLNLAHLMPLSAVWAGPSRDAHLAGPPLLHARTTGSTPFRLALHVGDVGHMLVVGPTGAGKSVLLALLALQFRRYARQARPFDAIGEQTVAVQVTSVVRASDRSFQVKWSETAYARGDEDGTSRWTAILGVRMRPPNDADTLRRNPLGIYVDAIDWSRELESPATPGTPANATPAIETQATASRGPQPGRSAPEETQ